MAMHDFIVITLCAPLASWGAPTTGPIRPCTVGPTKSGITGFFAAALGVQRSDQRAIDRLAADYSLGCAVPISGAPVVDYHTMRRDQENTNAFQTWRHYRSGYLAVACLWRRVESPLYPPEQIVRFCNSPVYAPYIGRRTCTLALPPDARLVQSVDAGIKAIETALGRLLSPLAEEIKGNSTDVTGGFHYYWEEDFPMGIKPLTRTERHDYPLSNTRRQFVSRMECEAIVIREGEHVLEQN